MEAVFCVHHPVEQPSIAAGEFVIDVQIPNLPDAANLDRLRLILSMTGIKGHIVVSRE
jgi:hypothetical protein